MEYTVESVRKLLATPENERLEFKTNVNPTLNRIIVAFANTEGGTIVIGFNEKEIVGITPDAIKKAQRLINKDNLQSVCSLQMVDIDEKQLLIIDVAKAEKLLFADGLSYVRRGYEIHRMSPTEVSNHYAHSIGVSSFSNAETTRDYVSREAYDEILTLVKKLTEQLTTFTERYDQDQENDKNEKHRDNGKNFKLNLFFCILSAIIGFVLSAMFL